MAIASFTIADNNVATSPQPQSWLYRLDLQILSQGHNDYGVISGGVVVQRGPGVNMSVDVGASTTRHGLIEAIRGSTTNVALSAADPVLYRLDTIVIDITGTARVRAGTARGLTLLEPGDPVDTDVILAYVLVRPGVTSILTADVEDRRNNLARLARLDGLIGGQSLNGGLNAGDYLLLASTAHATKGPIYFGTAGLSKYDEAANLWTVLNASTAVNIAPGALGIPSVFQVLEGSAGAPVTGNNNATFVISRTAAMSVVNDGNAALWVNHRNAGATQPVAVQGYTDNTSTGDACSFYARANTVSGRAYSYFGISGFTSAAAGTPGAIGFNSYLVNGSTTGATWDGGGPAHTPFMAGVMLQYSQSTYLNGCGMFVGDNSHLDVGIGFKPGSVVNTTFRDDSSSVTSVLISGAHTNAIDLSGATASDSLIKLPAMTAYTPTVASLTGAITSYTASGRYMKFGKLVYFEVNISITNNGTGATTLLFTVPVSLAGATYVIAGRENATSGLMCQGYTTVGSANVFTQAYNNAYPVATGSNLFMSGWYETL